MVAVALSSAREKTSYFYVWMAAACAIIAIGGFAPTYWLQLPAGTFVGPSLLHIHGALFTAWPLLLLSQTLLVANGRAENHKAWGLAGISLATAMVVVGLTTAIHQLSTESAEGYGDAARAFFIVSATAITLFAGFFLAAIVNIGRPEIHKRMILLATISLLQAPMGRVFFILFHGGGPGLRPGVLPPIPVSGTVAPGLLLELLILAGVLFDWRTRGRPHAAWLIGAACMTAVVLLRVPASATSAWLAFANSVAHIAG